MKVSVIIFGLFTTVAMAELTKVPRSQKAVVARQAGEKVQTAAMVDADGNVVAFNAAGVAKDPAA
ncbi:hypothetical protein F4815DRAFT_159847 [Daldinia loculata]|uniref:uncharacterized protein n=1 Tax=Daldinia loculata TaxID=103429 RepID=UPI0020C280B1|nr:uncharacterized protein F4817DRAFT_187702 [Daldinia loculata]KAI1645258.1 hypothetical protein F4817DRAFT_187702 [Daldinia loculata]KAI2780118.1 hypothetical protein F4815DRAFT_159847 [Daldinia loculata]